MFFSTYMLMMATYTWLISFCLFVPAMALPAPYTTFATQLAIAYTPCPRRTLWKNSFFAFWYSASNFPSASPQNSPRDKLLFLRTVKSYPVNNNSNNKNPGRCQSTEKYHSDHIFHYYREHFLLLIMKSPE